MSKYEPLWKYIKDNKKELLDYGYEVVKISIKEKYVLIHKSNC